jgi:MFS family permease
MQQPISSGREKLILLLLSAIQFSHVLDFMVMMPLGPQLMRVFNITASEFGYIVSSYGISSGIAGLAVAPFIDKYDRKLFLNICLVGLLAGTLLCAVAESASMLMFARMVFRRSSGRAGECHHFGYFSARTQRIRHQQSDALILDCIDHWRSSRARFGKFLRLAYAFFRRLCIVDHAAYSRSFSLPESYSPHRSRNNYPQPHLADQSSSD